MVTATEAYLDPNVGFVGAEVLARKVPGLGVGEARRAVSDIEAAQRFRKMRRPRVFRRITAPPYSFQIDIVYLPFKKQNMKYALTIVDILSRYAFVYPISSRTMSEKPNIGLLLKAYKEFLEDVAQLRGVSTDPPVTSVHGDDEFAAARFLEFNMAKGIRVTTFVSKDDKKSPGNNLGILDRFVRTLKFKLNRWILTKDKPSYLEVLPLLVRNYNTTPHSAFADGATPEQVFLDPQRQSDVRFSNALHNMRASALQPDALLRIGDLVRYNIKTGNKFAKENATFSKAVERITGRYYNKFTISNVKRPFKGVELLRVRQSQPSQTSQTSQTSQPSQSPTIAPGSAERRPEPVMTRARAARLGPEAQRTPAVAPIPEGQRVDAANREAKAALRLRREGIVATCSNPSCSKGPDVPLLMCRHSGCPTAFHKACLVPQPETVPAHWYCNKHDSVCKVCSKRPGVKVMCSRCDGTYHLKCLNPKMKKMPDGEWFCARCGSKCGVCGKPALHEDLTVVCNTPGCDVAAHKDCTGGKEWLCPRHDDVCRKCNQKNDAPTMLLCDFEGCDAAYHRGCLDPVPALPPKGENWFCPDHDHGPLDDGKMCVKCQGRNRAKSMVQCNFCARNWHIDCLEPPLKNVKKEWYCQDHDSSCKVCHRRNNEANMLLCDFIGCDAAYHRGCLNPKLAVMPPADEDWFCPNHDHGPLDGRKMCVKCQGRNRAKSMVQCNQCERYWHIDCLNQPLKAVRKTWLCPEHIKKKKPKRV